MKNNNFCVIMAGGIGSRFWPLSRVDCPKQFVDILGIGKTFIQMTYERFSPFIPAENFIVVTGKNYKELTLQQLPEIKESQILSEPARRNTAPCLAYAAYKIRAINPDAVMVVTPADHLVLDTANFAAIVKKNLAYAANHPHLLTVGITPTFPSTGYGYIEKSSGEEDFDKVVSFKEKPDYETACRFIRAKNFLWNSGMFTWSVKTIIDAMQQFVPDIAQAFDNLSSVYGSQAEQEAVDKSYLACRSISIDYAIMEKSDKVYVTRGDFGWSDLGTWTSLYEQHPKDAANNAVAAPRRYVGNAQNCMIKELNNEKLVVVDSVENLLVVDTEDVLLICPRNDETHVKKLIEAVTSQHEQFK